MRKGIIIFMSLAVCIFLIGAVSGCSVRIYKGHVDDLEKISKLSGKVQELQSAKDLLEKRLKKEIQDKQVKLKLTKRGLVITFLNEVLFDSGKAEVRKEAYSALDKVIEVIKEKVPDRYIGIEGHTDDQPIKYSSWKSNWELSTSRATTVLHYLENGGIEPVKLQATGFGEYRPVVSNKTKEGRQENRRVEIVIMPEGINKISYEEEPVILEKEMAVPEEDVTGYGIK